MFAALLLAAVAASQIVVVDGDTIEYAGRSWRLKGFDTPETRYAKCEAEYRLGMRAKDRLRALIDGARSLELIDQQKGGGYGRKLGDLVIDGKPAAAIMIPDYARPCGGPGCRKSWCKGLD